MSSDATQPLGYVDRYDRSEEPMELKPAEAIEWTLAGDEHFTGEVWFGPFETSYGTMEVGDALWENSREEVIAEMGLNTGSISSSPEGTTFTTEWHALPDEVAAVVLYDQGQPLGWQRPVSGTAAF